ncbi:MAG: endonuclease/exonuclease/phosphatase family protein [Leucobacter sp.]
MRTISYNLRKNRAVGELASLVSKHKAEMLCLQEANAVSLPAHIGPLKLVHATEKNRLGLAMYVHGDRFQVRSAHTFQLKKSLHDRMLSPAHERLLGARIHDRETHSDFVAASFHAAPLTAPNSLRRSQINTAITELRALGAGLPTLMIGDYNYPIFQKNLAKEMKGSGFELSRSDKRTYTRYLVFRGHYDFVTSSGFDVAQVSTLTRGSSDHLPIMVTASHTPKRDVAVAA